MFLELRLGRERRLTLSLDLIQEIEAVGNTTKVVLKGNYSGLDNKFIVYETYEDMKGKLRYHGCLI